MGICVVRKFTPKEVEYIAVKVCNVLVETFDVLREGKDILLAKMLEAKMFFANISDGKRLSNVNYLYENNAIYFDVSLNLSTINDKIMHECIHYLQAIRTEKGKLKKIGLIEFEDLSSYGLGMNEAAVQYIASKATGNILTTKKIEGIVLKTISPNYYPLLTNLIQQLIYVMGEDIIIKGTIQCDEKFEQELFNTYEEHAVTIIKAFDKMIDLQNKKNEGILVQSKPKVQKKIIDTYLEIQNRILKIYFDKICNRLTTIEEVNFYIEKLTNYKPLFGFEEATGLGLHNNYEQYKEQVLKKLDRRMLEISKENSKNTLSIIYQGKLFQFFKKIISYFSVS